ncbi:hypothetical protein HYH03_007455 [Edaphochlamys debaryana]|uniref:Cytochrome P450 n=1 Tax=Edaphochlamys debaryana TaxID=47281 RepID=A0A835Y1V9_9CHLO|nr:hypothetical protein HYH03_007455 [Edaphochlamys debaryana]|eukprot:KAG2494403.1 hypothetical protein HYH03_007455 [Edaphochlamys debaryana]
MIANYLGWARESPGTAAVTLLPLVPLTYLVYLVTVVILWPWLKALPSRKALGLIPGPKGYPLVGCVIDLIRTPIHQKMQQWVCEYGTIFRVDLPAASAIVVTHPEEVARIIKVERFDKFLQGYGSMEMLTSTTMPNILTVPMGPYYKALRKAVTPAFSTANLKLFYPTVLKLTHNVMDHIRGLGEGAAIDMDAAAQRLTIDVIGRFAFDRDFAATEFGRNEALETVADLMLGLQRMMNPINRWFWWTKESRALVATRRRFDSVVSRALADLRGKPPAPYCLMSHLLGVVDPRSGKVLSGEQLKAETALFWIAGFETTAHAIGWTLMFISTHPQVEEKIAAELEAVGLLAMPGAAAPREVEWGDLGGLRYLNSVIQEAMRLMPPASGGTARQASREVKLGGYTVPKGTMLWIPVYALQRSPHVWGPDAEEFKPERWTAATTGASEADEDEVVRSAGTMSARGWLPFSEGPRSCIGQSLAVLELRTSLAMLCGHFRFRLADEMGGCEATVQAARQHITLKPGDKGLLMHAIPRAP